MRFFVFLLLSFHFCCSAYGQEAFQYSCDEYPSLLESFSETFEEIIANLDTENSANNNLNNHIDFMTFLVWDCSNDASEFNNIILYVLNTYLTEPRMKAHIFRFLKTLSSKYEEVETYNEENNIVTRSTRNAIWVTLSYYGLKVISKVGGRIGRLFNLFGELSWKWKIAIFGGLSTAPAVVSEFNEDDLEVKIDPSILRDSLFAFEAYNLTHSACELNEDLKTIDITGEGRFNELASIHESLRNTYQILKAERPGLFITQDPNPSSENQEVDLPSQLSEKTYEEVYRLFQFNWIPVDPKHEICQNNEIINLDVTGCHLQESARALNNSPFSSDSIQFQTWSFLCHP